MVFYIISLIILLTGCTDDSYEEKIQERIELAEQSKISQKPIIIGIAGVSSVFIQGAQLAVKEINADGGILNRPLELIINTDEESLAEPSLSAGEYQNIVINVAESFANNPRLIAVIGHSKSKAALLASVVYQNNGVLFFASNATNLRLTNHKFDYLFRTIPNNYELGTHIADYVAEQGYKNIILLYDRSIYGIELADNFSVYAQKKHGINIVLNRSFFKNTVNLTALMIDLNKIDDADLIFVASDAEFSQILYQKSRDMDIRIPFVGGETLATRNFLSKVKDWESSAKIKKTIIPTLFNPLLAENQTFVDAFTEETNLEAPYFPEPNAALGYDNIILLAHAIKRAQSTVPLRIADSLRYMQPCRGTAGDYQFSENGELYSKPFYFRSLKNNRYDFQQLNSEKNKTHRIIERCNQIDLDEDTIPNDLDACPDNTPEELAKGITLTGLLRGCPLDSDADEVADYHDDCPENTREERAKGVNKQGCPIDSDQDKTPDYEDACPNNPELTQFIDGKNCVEDQDGDEITDDIDQCPKNTPEEIAKGVNKTGEQQGCPVDTDLDKVVDYLDACPENSLEEVSQGVNSKGCPADQDHDGILDYQDQCLETPDNVTIDQQGCGIIETNIMLQASNIYFKRGKITLTTEGKSYLKALLGQTPTDLLKEIKIIVHTDNRGTTKKNQTLSEEQAITIADYFFNHGIACEKIISEGKGGTDPIANNSNYQGRQQNHRLEIILKQFKNKPMNSNK